MVDDLRSGGDSKVELFTFSFIENNKGCAQHPDQAAQQAMGELLAARIKAIMNW